MNAKLNMIGSTEEDKEMMRIIRDNHFRVQKLNQKRAKYMKRETIINNVMLVVSSGIFFIGLMCFIALIEGLRF